MLPFSAACERNKDPILAVLRGVLAGRREVLEIGSGSGQHAVHFARHLPHLTWHPTEREPHLRDLARRVREEGGANLRQPASLDVRQENWPLQNVDAIFSANTQHIMSWEEVEAMWRGAGTLLAADGVLCLYGPFRYGGAYTSPSNREFDQRLRERDPLSGLRDLGDLVPLGRRAGLELRADHDLPAFNRLLVFHKTAASREDGA